MGKKATKKTSFTKLIVWIAVGVIAAIAIIYRTDNYGFAGLIAALAFAIGLASMVQKKK